MLPELIALFIRAGLCRHLLCARHDAAAAPSARRSQDHRHPRLRSWFSFRSSVPQVLPLVSPPASPSGTATKAFFSPRAPVFQTNNEQAPLYGARLLDIAPTALHSFGLRVGADMEGPVLSEIFPGNTLGRTIPTWGRLEGPQRMAFSATKRAKHSWSNSWPWASLTRSQPRPIARTSGLSKSPDAKHRQDVRRINFPQLIASSGGI